MLNENIKNLRSARGLSQVELAKKLGVTKQSISNWENNYIQPSVEMLVKLSKIFSVSTDFMLGLDEKNLLDVTGLSEAQTAHIRQIIDDILGK